MVSSSLPCSLVPSACFPRRRFILMQDKAARLSEHLYEDHEECVGGRDLGRRGGVDGVLALILATSWPPCAPAAARRGS